MQSPHETNETYFTSAFAREDTYSQKTGRRFIQKGRQTAALAIKL